MDADEGELSQPRDQGADPAGPCAKPKARHWRSSSTISRKATAIDLIFLMADLLKIVQGGWMPLAVGAVLMVVMLTWCRGTPHPG